MRLETLSPSGGPVDACWHQGRLVVVWQDGPGPNAQLVERVYGWGSGLSVAGVTYPLGDDVGAFPRLMSDGSDVWLLYREGRSRGGQAILRKNGIVVWRSPSECGGNDPVCFGVEHGRPSFAWQKAGTNEIFSGLVGWPAAQLPSGEGRPTGLSHIQASGLVVLVDDARVSVPGVTRPCWAGALVCGEHPVAGTVVRAEDGRESHLWATRATFTPRLAYDAERDRYACVTWNGRDGVLVAYLEAGELTSPVVVPPPVVPPPSPEGPMSLLGTVEFARRAYGPTMNDDQCVELCNLVAWTHKNEGWGLSRKTTGTRGRRYDGQECAHDVLVDASGVEYDILTAAGGASTPTWGKTGGFARPGREWVAPVVPQGAVVTPPTPQPPIPTPQPPPVVACQYAPTDLTVVLAYLKEIRAKLEVSDARVDALRDRIESINAEMHQMVVGQVQGLLEAIQGGRR